MMIVVVLLNFFILFFAAYGLWRNYRQDEIGPFYWPGLLLKAVGGIALGFIYKEYYTTGDTFLFFEDGKRLAAYGRSDFLAYLQFLLAGDETSEISSHLIYSQYRALFMAKITSVASLLTYDNYWIITLYFSFVSFACAWLLVKVIADSFPVAKWGAILAFLFFPSVVFWSSGVIKESVAVAGLFFLSAAFVKLWTKQNLKWWEWILIVLAAWFVWSLKYYYLAVFLPVAVAALVTQRLSYAWEMERVSLRILLWVTAFIIPVALVSTLHPNFYPHHILEVIVDNNNEFNNLSHPEDLIHYSALEPTVASMLKNAPLAVASGIFRPFIWEARTGFQWMIALENILMLVLFLPALSNMVKCLKSREFLLIWSVAFYVVALCIFLALSTPNFGTLSRYRISFLPFFLLLITIENPLIKKLSGLMQRS